MTPHCRVCAVPKLTLRESPKLRSGGPGRRRGTAADVEVRRSQQLLAAVRLGLLIFRVALLLEGIQDVREVLLDQRRQVLFE